MKSKLLSVLLLVCALAATDKTSAQGFIGNGVSGGDGIQAVNSGGTVTGVNVGIGVASTTSTLEVSAPSNLSLKFDNLPNTTTSYVLYYDGTGTVTYGSAPAAGITSVDYDCGIGTLTITPTVGSPITTTYKAWLLSGSTTGSNDYFGTFNNDDIRISTYNNNCAFNIQKQKMIVAKDGSVGIGSYDGTNNPLYPQNS